jgi:hypothetical protein
MYGLLLIFSGWCCAVYLMYRFRVKSKLAKIIMIVLFFKILILSIIYIKYFSKKEKINFMKSDKHFIYDK